MQDWGIQLLQQFPVAKAKASLENMSSNIRGAHPKPIQSTKNKNNRQNNTLHHGEQIKNYDTNTLIIQNCHEKKHWLDYAIFIFVILTTIATGFAACYTRQQWKTAEDSEKRQLRAYVDIAPGDYTGLGSDTVEFHMVRKNYGQTPAYDVGFVTQQMDITPLNAPIPNPAQKCTIAPPEGSLITLFPQNELRFTFSVTHGISNEQANAVKLRSAQIVFSGTLCYRDAFGKHHWKNYCWVFSGANTTSKDAEACLGRNDADRDE
jgi:hypothetical protein